MFFCFIARKITLFISTTVSLGGALKQDDLVSVIWASLKRSSIVNGSDLDSELLELCVVLLSNSSRLVKFAGIGGK